MQLNVTKLLQEKEYLDNLLISLVESIETLADKDTEKTQKIANDFYTEAYQYVKRLKIKKKNNLN